jgi:hypothetical protein
VPVTRLSQLFHERFGDEIADEVVYWFNAVEANSRSDLREINELNFARCDAKLEQRFVEQDVRIEKRFAEQDARIEKRFAEQEVRMEKRFADMEKRLVVLEAKLDTRLSEMHTVMERSMKEHARWMQLSWATMMAGIIALYMRP